MYDLNKDATRKQRHLQNLQTSEILSCFMLCRSQWKWPTKKDRKLSTDAGCMLRISKPGDEKKIIRKNLMQIGRRYS